MILEVDHRHDAIEDCKAALKFDAGDGTFTALNEHLAHWSDATGLGDMDYPYYQVICEIKSKLFTDECLLK